MRILLILHFALILFSILISLILGETKPQSLEMENPFILIKKSERTLEVFDGERLIKSYSISLGFAPKGDKEIEGDGKTPEGDFYIFTKNPQSSFFLSLGISHPNIEDAERGLKNGIISKSEYDEISKAIAEKGMPPQKTKLGGEVYIHGGGCRAD